MDLCDGQETSRQRVLYVHSVLQHEAGVQLFTRVLNHQRSSHRVQTQAGFQRLCQVHAVALVRRSRASLDDGSGAAHGACHA